MERGGVAERVANHCIQDGVRCNGGRRIVVRFIFAFPTLDWGRLKYLGKYLPPFKTKTTIEILIK